MADNDATRKLFRELLNMTDGGTAGGRGGMMLPDEIMDSLSGDAAQEELARDRLIMEMQHQDRSGDGHSVDLALMEMESTDVDSFLATARKKIIKRSKPTRKGCCGRIGGVLDQMMGTAGGEYADDEEARDRGKFDPIGDADDTTTYKKVKVAEGEEDRDRIRQVPGAGGHDTKRRVKGFVNSRGLSSNDVEDAWSEKGKKGKINLAFKGGGNWSVNPKGRNRYLGDDVDLLNFIAEEFAPYEHDDDCPLADPKFSQNTGPLGEERFIQSNSAHGLLRDAYKLPLPLKQVQEDYDHLSERSRDLVGPERRLFERLGLFLNALTTSDQDSESTTSYQEDVDMEVSQTANALSRFMESSSYKSADAGSGKGSPSPGAMNMGMPKGAGDLDQKHRYQDDDDYPTRCAPMKSGGPKKISGEPTKVGTRGVDRGDPIGEANMGGAFPGVNVHFGNEPKKLSDEEQFARARKLRDQRKKEHYAKLRAKWGAEKGDLADDVDYDGPQISETANALSNFMEASGQYAAAKERLALRTRDAGQVADPRERDKQRLGRPLEAAKGKRGGLETLDDGGSKARWEKGANPIGGGHEEKAAGKRLKN